MSEESIAKEVQLRVKVVPRVKKPETKPKTKEVKSTEVESNADK